MMIRKAYTIKNPAWSVLCTFSWRISWMLIIILLFQWPSLHGQDEQEYEEIPLFLEIQGFGGTDITGVLNDKDLFLPVSAMFDFLKIRNVPAPGFESVSGFFINPEAEYLISRTDNLIRYNGKTINLNEGDLIRTENDLYLKTGYFGSVFGLTSSFSFRNLNVTISSQLELPLIREMRLEEMRRNLTRLKGDVAADTTIGRTYPMFKFGMADWAVTAREEINGASDVRANLSLGAMIAGGEATASLNYSTSDPFSEKQQYYLWRYVNNDFSPVRQVMAGKIATQAFSSLYSPVIGVQLTNTPTTYRRSFGSYTLSDKTEPGWIVELYINNTLIDYVKADASGFFTFEVPMVYGNSIVRLKFYGPWGEERTREQNINIPFNFLPAGTMEYNVSAGIVEDSLASRFSKARISYGLSRNLTMGAGLEYLSSLPGAQAMPFVNASLRLTGNLLLSGEYIHRVRSKGTLSYRTPSNIMLDLLYSHYDRDQKAINFNYREERKATLAMPLRMGKVSAYQRFSYYQILLPASQYSTAEWLISGSLRGVSTNLTTYAMMMDNIDPFVYSNLSLAFRLPARFVLMPQAQYSYTQNEFQSVKLAVEKHLLDHAFLNASYERNFSNGFSLAEFGLRYDFSFAQAGASVRQAGGKTSLIQYARGSLINDRPTRFLGAYNRTNVGKGGITLVAFLDLNSNKIMDRGEPKAPGLNLRASGGIVERSARDTTVRITGLEPYTSCFIEIDPDSFDNVAWRVSARTFSVTVDPNIMKLVGVPVDVAGEATGYVHLESGGENFGLGRIIMEFSTSGNIPAGKALTESDGYYSLFGLAPGSYYVKPDKAQLGRLNYSSDPDSIPFTIMGGNVEGDIADGLDFIIRTREIIPVAALPDSAPSPITIVKDTTYLIIHELTEELYTITEDSWAIQVGAFKDRSYAEGFRSRLEKELGKEVKIVIEGDFFRVRILDLPTRAEVDETVRKLNEIGFNELWIIRLVAKQQQRVLVTREDSLARISETRIERVVTPEFVPGLVIQAGAFRDKSNALALRDKLDAMLDKPVVIVTEDGYDKVRIAGFESLEELERYLPVLGMLGIRDIWIPPVKTPEVGVKTAEPLAAPYEEPHYDSIPALARIMPDSLLKLAPETDRESLSGERPVVKEPPVSLQVAVYHSKARAMKARRKIMKNLGLPVEIAVQWEYYRVIIPGFMTREETYRYYPELAGLGFDSIYMIDKSQGQ